MALDKLPRANRRALSGRIPARLDSPNVVGSLGNFSAADGTMETGNRASAKDHGDNGLNDQAD
jgi:hypothetical protein